MTNATNTTNAANLATMAAKAAAAVLDNGGSIEAAAAVVTSILGNLAQSAAVADIAAPVDPMADAPKTARKRSSKAKTVKAADPEKAAAAEKAAAKAAAAAEKAEKAEKAAAKAAKAAAKASRREIPAKAAKAADLTVDGVAYPVYTMSAKGTAADLALLKGADRAALRRGIQAAAKAELKPCAVLIQGGWQWIYTETHAAAKIKGFRFTEKRGAFYRAPEKAAEK